MIDMLPLDSVPETKPVTEMRTNVELKPVEKQPFEHQHVTGSKSMVKETPKTKLVNTIPLVETIEWSPTC